MQGRNHVALAIAGALAVGGPGFDPPAWGALVVGSLAPDLDGGGHIAYAGSTFLPRVVPRPIRKLVDAVGVGISAFVRKLLGHRGALHWPVWGVLMWLVGYSSGLTWLQWLGFGYVAHIAGDMLTKSGVPIFGPLLPKKDISIFPMRTGSALETMVGVGLWAFVGWRAWPYVSDTQYLWALIHRFSGLVSPGDLKRLFIVGSEKLFG